MDIFNNEIIFQVILDYVNIKDMVSLIQTSNNINLLFKKFNDNIFSNIFQKDFSNIYKDLKKQLSNQKFKKINFKHLYINYYKLTILKNNLKFHELINLDEIYNGRNLVCHENISSIYPIIRSTKILLITKEMNYHELKIPSVIDILQNLETA